MANGEDRMFYFKFLLVLITVVALVITIGAVAIVIGA